MTSAGRCHWSRAGSSCMRGLCANAASASSNNAGMNSRRRVNVVGEGKRTGSDVDHVEDAFAVALRIAEAVGIDKDLAGGAGLEALHPFGEILHGDPIGDDRVQVELSGLEKRSHLVPGLVHAAAIDALHGGAFENDVVGQINFDGL